MALRTMLNRITWALFKQETVGFDKVGNKYYRRLEKSLDGDLIERRLVKYAGDWDPAAVPPEWLQWLRRVRAEPPTGGALDAGAAARDAARARAESADAAAAEEVMRRAAGGGGGQAPDFTQQLGGEEGDGPRR